MSSLIQAPSIMVLRHCRVSVPSVHHGGYRLVDRVVPHASGCVAFSRKRRLRSPQGAFVRREEKQLSNFPTVLSISEGGCCHFFCKADKRKGRWHGEMLVDRLQAREEDLRRGRRRGTRRLKGTNSGAVGGVSTTRWHALAEPSFLSVLCFHGALSLRRGGADQGPRMLFPHQLGLHERVSQ